MKLFPITLLVEPEAVGTTLAALKKMRGILDIDLNLDKKKSGHLNGAEPSRQPNRFSTTAEEDLLDMLYDGQMTTAQLKSAFAERGRAPGSVSSTLTNVKKEGDIKEADVGEGWVLTKRTRDRIRHRVRAAKALEKKAAKQAKQKK